MQDAAPTPVYRQDYRPPGFLIDDVDLVFDLRDDGATVTSRLSVRRNPAVGVPHDPLVLNGVNLKLTAIAMDGAALAEDAYTIAPDSLTIPSVPDAFVLDTTVELDPHGNTSLEGLYISGGNFCTQCEAEGFRKIAYFLDRPDVMSRYTTTVVADKAKCPVLLSNGNRLDGGDAQPGRHWAKWQDPVPKPSYLFALVAGDLVALEDAFVTRSGRSVPLRIYVRQEDLDQCAHAMASLKESMAWDERTYGLEYDLEQFNIVAVSDFNAGAMENKSLNVFNTALVLAKPDTATDGDYRRIEGVVAHEYFHNWTGNRITCRDWFQLTLKEGLTVFRDQEFSADQGSRAVKRIQDVRRLRASQFPEDAGPLAHPIRPDSYIGINNFYTPTVYEKGAEVIRMIQTLVGRGGFRAGMDLYVQRHDLQAVTCEDFVKAMEDANGIDLGQFRLWYAQAGTPELTIEEDHDPHTGTYGLTVRQYVPSTPDQANKQPMHIPLAVGLLDQEGRPLPVRLDDGGGEDDDTAVLSVREAEQRFVFTGYPSRPVPSLLRDFSAPVKLIGQPRDRLAFLFANDVDPFARWEAGQQLATQLLLDMIAAVQRGDPAVLDDAFIEAFAKTLSDQRLDKAMTAEALTLPSADFLADQMAVVDVEAIHAARSSARRTLAGRLRQRLMDTFDANREAGDYSIDPDSMGRRALKNLCLDLLTAQPDGGEALALTLDQYRSGINMTDVLAALTILSHLDLPEREDAFADFYERWRDHDLVIDKWFSLQAMSHRPDTLAAVRELLQHPAFDIKVPNRARSLIAAFAYGNPLRFHGADGGGYDFLAEQVLRLEPLNPLTAARLLTPLGRWRRQDPGRQGLMKAALERILATPNLAKDVYEVASKSLA